MGKYCSGMRRLAWPAACLLLAGTGVAQTYGPPAPAKPDELPAGSAQPPGIAPDLAAATKKAVETYPAVRAAEANIRAAASDVRAAKWQWAPSVSVEAQALAGGSAIVRDQNVAANVVVDQPLYEGGRVSGGIRRAHAVERQSRAAADEAAQDVALRVVTAYFNLVQAARHAEILERGVAEHRALVESISRRVQQEVSPPVDLELARSRTAQLEQQIAANAAQRHASLQQFRDLVGDPNYELGTVPAYDAATDHPLPEGAIEQAVMCSPTRRRLQAEALIARADVNLADAQKYPQLFAEFQSNEVTGQRAGVVLRAGLNGGLSQFQAANSARIRRDSADIQIQTAEREARDAITADLSENAAARERVTSARAAATAARDVTDSYQRLFVVGRRTWLDVLNAALEANQSEIAAADAEVSAMGSTARLLLRTCRWQPEPPLSK